MSEFSAECQAANRIAAQLRGVPAPKKLTADHRRTPAGKPVRAYATGIAGKSEYLRVRMKARLAEVLAYCHEFYAENDQLPPQACVAQRFEVVEQVAQKYMRALGTAGSLERNAVGKWRFARGPRT